MSTALITTDETFVPQQFTWTEEDLQALHESTCKNLTPAEFKVFVLNARRRGLDPFAKQIYAWKSGTGPMTTQVSIDGMRTLAERTKLYRGQLGPFWCGEDGEWKDMWLAKGAPVACKVGVLRAGWKEPLWGFARTAAYTKGNDFWNKMPEVMIAKVAESVALRKAFPQVLGGIYVPEEINSVQDEVAAYIDADPTPASTVTVTPEPVQPAEKPAAPQPKAKVAPPAKSAEQTAEEIEAKLKERALNLGFTSEQYVKRRKELGSYAKTAAALNAYEAKRAQAEAMADESGENPDAVSPDDALESLEETPEPEHEQSEQPMSQLEMHAWELLYDRHTKAGGDSESWDGILRTAHGDLQLATSMVNTKEEFNLRDVPALSGTGRRH